MKILTFDIEDWYNCDFISNNFNWNSYEVRIYEGVDRILQHLENENIKATFFCLGWIAQNHPDIIKRIHSHGHHIGCHSYQHQLLYRLNRKEFIEDTLKAKTLLENLIGSSVDSYRAPGFSVSENNLWVFEELYNLGFRYDCSVLSAKHDYGGFKNFKINKPVKLKLSNGNIIKEFPMSTFDKFGNSMIFSGGGYFRFYPYSLIKLFSKNSDYLMTYFHPRDFDPNQPILKNLPFIRKFKSYVGLKYSFSKFKRYTKDFDFISLKEASEKIDWNKTDTIIFDDK